METYKIIIKALKILIVFSISFTFSYSQTSDKECNSSGASQFDFWVGSWQLDWKNTDGTIAYGTNVIKKIMGNCVIEENFSTADQTYTGKSLSIYNGTKNIWQQTWVDNGGSYLDFTGGMVDDRMILSRNSINKNGQEVIQKMTFYDITDNEFNWNWEISNDSGKTWTLLWKIHYTRKEY